MNIVDYNPLEEFERNRLKKQNNNIYLSDNQIEVLNSYHINYQNCTNIKELLFLVEEYLNDGLEATDLEIVSQQLADYNYYYHTDK